MRMYYFKCDGCGKKWEHKFQIVSAVPLGWMTIEHYGGGLQHACSGKCLEKVAKKIALEERILSKKYQEIEEAKARQETKRKRK